MLHCSKDQIEAKGSNFKEGEVHGGRQEGAFELKNEGIKFQKLF